MKLKIGIDDAGRGPVIGPMVLAGVLVSEEDEEKLKEWGVKDSKLLNKEKRKEIYKKILKNFETFVELAFPEEIDKGFMSGSNLNKLEAKKAGMIINGFLKNRTDRVEILIDCPSVNINSWQNYLLKYIEKPGIIDLKCEHKADFNHLVVGAASIVAKEVREEEIEKIKQKFKIDFGTGYCCDPITCEFLEGDMKDLEGLGLIRKTWQTWSRVLEKREQKKLFD